jgi:hypothetical protein
MQVLGANVSIVLNWIALVSLLSLPFSFFTRAGERRGPFCGARRPLQQVDCERGFGR